MSVLVTGGAGYIGSVVVETLLAYGESVVVLDNLTTGHRDAIPAIVPFYPGDCGDDDMLSAILRSHPIKECIHMAGLISMADSVQQPYTYFDQNVRQSVEMFASLIGHGVKQFVFSSSCAAQDPIAPYGWTKHSVEQMLHFFHEAYETRNICLRYHNAAGATELHGEAHDPETHLIPNVLAVAAGEAPYVEIFGHDYKTYAPGCDGTAVRDYIHVSDLAKAHLSALQVLRTKPANLMVNLGTGRPASVLKVVHTAEEVTGKKIPIRFGNRRPGDLGSLVADTKPAQELLAWNAVHDLRSVIQSAWKWKQQRKEVTT